MIFKDYYKILGLETNKVTTDEIKIAFREQAKKFHPDINEGSTAEERFKDINEAYRILSNPSQKRKYDRTWYSYVGKKIEKKKQKIEREARPDILTLLFGIVREGRKKPNKKAPQKGDNIETEISIKLNQAFNGINEKISLRTVDGKMKTFQVKVPQGIRNGERIRLIGQGKEGENGGKNGDLLIKVNIQNSKKFKLKGYDIFTDLIITASEAALGIKTKIQTLADGEANIYIPPGIQSGEKIRLPQKGYKDGKGGRGDLIVEIKIAVPKELSEQERKLYQKLAEISKFNPRKQEKLNINKQKILTN